MQDCASVREMLFSTRLSVHLSHSSSSSFIRAEQQDGRAHLGLIVGLPLLTNPAHCRRNKEINKQGLEKGREWKIQLYGKQFKGFQLYRGDHYFWSLDKDETVETVYWLGKTDIEGEIVLRYVCVHICDHIASETYLWILYFISSQSILLAATKFYTLHL